MAIASRRGETIWEGALAGSRDTVRGDTGRLGRDARAFTVVAAAMVVAGGLVAAVNSAAPFEHGSWLAAYLVLVGGVSQIVLGVGRLAMPAPSRSPRLLPWQIGLWNGGGAIVAVGVFGEWPAVVLAGSALVLAALACFWVGAGPSRPGARRRVALYRLAVLALAASVLVGCMLAGAVPGG